MGRHDNTFQRFSKKETIKFVSNCLLDFIAVKKWYIVVKSQTWQKLFVWYWSQKENLVRMHSVCIEFNFVDGHMAHEILADKHDSSRSFFHDSFQF